MKWRKGDKLEVSNVSKGIMQQLGLRARNEAKER
jgi:hypothetical protein